MSDSTGSNYNQSSPCVTNSAQQYDRQNQFVAHCVKYQQDLQLPNQITVEGNKHTHRLKRCLLITKFIGILLMLVNKMTLNSKLYSLLNNHFKCLNGGDGWASLEFQLTTAQQYKPYKERITITKNMVSELCMYVVHVLCV